MNIAILFWQNILVFSSLALNDMLFHVLQPTFDASCSCLLSRLCRPGIRNGASGDKNEIKGLDITPMDQNSGYKKGTKANFVENVYASNYPYQQKNKMTPISHWL